MAASLSGRAGWTLQNSRYVNWEWDEGGCTASAWNRSGREGSNQYVGVTLTFVCYIREMGNLGKCDKSYSMGALIGRLFLTTESGDWGE